MSDDDRPRIHSAADKQEANKALLTGAGIGAWGVASAALLGSVCPMCVIAAPALLGYGAYKRWQCRDVQQRGGEENAAHTPMASVAVAPQE